MTIDYWASVAYLERSNPTNSSMVNHLGETLFDRLHRLHHDYTNRESFEKLLYQMYSAQSGKLSKGEFLTVISTWPGLEGLRNARYEIESNGIRISKFDYYRIAVYANLFRISRLTRETRRTESLKILALLKNEARI